MAASLSEAKERALLGVVERAARTHAEALVLRGGLVVRRYVAPTPRKVDDVDFLGLGEPAALREALPAICALGLDDGVVYEEPTIEVIWEETRFPGLRARTLATVDGAAIPLQIDVGFGDPRVVPDPWVALDGTRTPMPVVAAETLFAWKLHGLFERGHGQWRPKDLFDLLLLGRCALDEERLPECVRVAFESRGDTLALTERFLNGPWGRSGGSARKWKSFRRKGNDHAPVELGPVLDEVQARVRPVVERARRS
jgi:hypothetical protein